VVAERWWRRQHGGSVGSTVAALEARVAKLAEAARQQRDGGEQRGKGICSAVLAAAAQRQQAAGQQGDKAAVTAVAEQQR
jgi:hypothetical protein